MTMTMASPEQRSTGSSISMVTVTAIVGGVDTEQHRKTKHKHPERCVSLVAYDRTLNVTLRNADEASRLRRALFDILDQLGIQSARFA